MAKKKDSPDKSRKKLPIQKKKASPNTAKKAKIPVKQVKPKIAVPKTVLKKERKTVRPAKPVKALAPKEEPKPKRKPPIRPRVAKPKMPPLKTEKVKEPTIPLHVTITDVESTKFEIALPEKPAPTVQQPRELPKEYGETKIVLLVRDPEWVFAYWEINDEIRFRHGLERGAHTRTLAFRVYDITDIIFDGTNAHRYYDVIINDYALSWYLRMPEVNRSWCVDLGYYEPKSGDFVLLARSNTVTTPAGRISHIIDEKWMQVSQEHLEEILRLSGGFGPFDFRGSENVIRDISEKLKIQVEQAGGASVAVASGQIPPRPATKKDFWLVVNTDLILYGATEPNAKVTVQGKAVPLRKDGTFSVRFTLPDGTMVIPVRAVNASGDKEREIIPKVKKETN
ncbi:MAG: DUF4912 domain-containing protein [Candidatus Sumerlaeota bacterium]|nr:DUF4912 domain-containing protein [Candidatus Sumerlaeota bacterium]